MEHSEIEALLGRSLTTIELKNLDLYLDIAKESLEGLLCSSLKGSENETRVFVGNGDFRTVFTGIFHEVSEVKVDGETVDTSDYNAAQWDKRSSSWYNSIVFTTPPEGEVEVTANWGFTEVPNDLKRLWAQLFANVGKQYKPGAKIASKQVEDFRIQYVTGVTDDQQFIADNQRTLTKYSLCTIGEISNGKVWCGR